MMDRPSRKQKMEALSISPIHSLPSDCISHMISLASPRDACMLALASTGFRSVVDTDNTWQLFLPTDIDSILFRAVNPVLFSSKKDLLVKLCNQHVLIDGGNLSFGLDKSSGKKCYMLSATQLDISFADESNTHWRWISPPDSRFSNVAEKMGDCQLYIHGRINREGLSTKTMYGAYLIYKMIETSSDDGPLVLQITLDTSVTTNGHISNNTAHLKTMLDDVVETFSMWQDPIHGAPPKERRDGWMEVEIGEFYNENGDDGEVEIRLKEKDTQYWKGLIVQGLEIRPKN
ncbi:F-box protein [Rhynchospora pubera]|uniref:F-box protein n=1 Tax=Rhynchospora pubera TaxID=906938 RepID=A0AAV8E9I6_9POAL|nr:F-box protein [Rhynchospora pubera]